MFGMIRREVYSTVRRSLFGEGIVINSAGLLKPSTYITSSYQYSTNCVDTYTSPTLLMIDNSALLAVTPQYDCTINKSRALSTALPSPLSYVSQIGATSLNAAYNFISDCLDDLEDLFTTSTLNMSSTLKKRRSKMNKHKLKKRRKVLRKKTKKR